MSLGARIAGGVAACYFIYAAVMQLNDVDAWSWFAIYGVAAVLSGMLVIKRRASGAMLSLAVGGWVWGGMLLPDLLAEQRGSPRAFFESELAREVVGLGLMGAILLGLWLATALPKWLQRKKAT